MTTDTCTVVSRYYISQYTITDKRSDKRVKDKLLLLSFNHFRSSIDARNVQSTESSAEKSKRLEARSPEPEKTVSGPSSLHSRNHQRHVHKN